MTTIVDIRRQKVNCRVHNFTQSNTNSITFYQYHNLLVYGVMIRLSPIRIFVSGTKTKINEGRQIASSTHGSTVYSTTHVQIPGPNLCYGQ